MDGHYRPSDLADDVAWLCEHLELERPLVVGCSMGGGIAVEFAARHPDLPCGIVVLNRSVIANPAQDSTIRKLAEMLRWRTTADRDHRDAGECSDRAPRSPGLRRRYRRTAMSTRPHVLAAVQEAFIDWAVKRHWPRCASPHCSRSPRARELSLDGSIGSRSCVLDRHRAHRWRRALETEASLIS